MAKPLTLRFDAGPGMAGSWAVGCTGATCGGGGGNDRPCMSLHYGLTRGIGQRAFDGVSLSLTDRRRDYDDDGATNQDRATK